MAAILTNVGRAAIATALKAQSIHLAWGTGDSDWDTTPVSPPVDDTELVAEIGRLVITQAQFCLPNPSGDIEVPPGKFSISAEPTKYLYLRFTHDFIDAPDVIIRELGVYFGTVVKNTVPEDKRYLEPDDIEEPGQLFTLERLRLERSELIRQRFEFVLQF